jgi:hypothetical protein
MRTALDATGSLTTVPVGSGLPGRRADAGVVRLTERDVAGPLLAGDTYGAPYDLLASFLGVAPASPKPTPAPETPPCSTPSPCWGTCCPTPRPDSSSSYEAFDLQALYNNNLHQVTIHVTITRLHPPRAVAAIINDADDHPGRTARRRSGIGRALLRTVLATAGTEQVFTSTNTSNQPMRSLLHAEHWSFSGELDGLDDGGIRSWCSTRSGSCPRLDSVD